MSNNPAKQEIEIPAKIRDTIEELQGKVARPQWASRIWDKLLTERERQKLGGDLEKCLNTLGSTVHIWMKAKDVSLLRAIADLAKRLGFIIDMDYEWILREIGETDDRADTQVRPRWNRDRGELSFQGTIARKLRSINIAKNIVTILDTFEVEGWPDRIDDPLPKRRDSQRLRETIANLNKNLHYLRFRADGTGQGVVWERR